MKICIINNLYKPYNRGGTERIIELLIKALIDQHQVLLITSQPDDYKNCQVSGRLTICRYNPFNLYYILDDYKKNKLVKFFWHLFDLFNFKVAKYALADLRKYQPDVVMTHNLKGLSYLIFSRIRKLKIPHIHFLHDYQLIDPQASLRRSGRNLSRRGPLLWLYGSITKALIKDPDLVISPSEFVLAKHQRYGFFRRSKFKIMPNPALMPLAIEQKRRSEKIRFLYLGQVEEHKGVAFLIKTFKEWLSSNATLNIAGAGSQLAAIKQQAASDARIKVLGAVERQEIDRLFSENDVLVVPSVWWENSPTVIYEAYCHSLPVLVSDSGGSKELIIAGQTGWVFRSNDMSDLTARLNEVVQAKDSLNRLGENAYKHVEQYSVKHYLTKLLTLCQSLKK